MIAEWDNEGIPKLFVPGTEWTQMKGFPRRGCCVGADLIFDWVFS